MKTRVSTSLVWPWICYILTFERHKWVFAHPEFWNRKGLLSDCHIDRNMVDKSRKANHSRGLFWEYVADSIIWPKPSDTADEIIRLSKIAAKQKEQITSGVMEMF